MGASRKERQAQRKILTYQTLLIALALFFSTAEHSYAKQLYLLCRSQTEIDLSDSSMETKAVQSDDIYRIDESTNTIDLWAGAEWRPLCNSIKLKCELSGSSFQVSGIGNGIDTVFSINRIDGAYSRVLGRFSRNGRCSPTSDPSASKHLF
jgi:hypothetical protein